MARSMEQHRSALRELLARTRPDDAAALLRLDAAAGRILAGDLLAPLALPPETNSQMDGFAVCTADLRAPRVGGDAAAAPLELPVVGISAAGSPPARHECGAATAVMTGAVLPEGADAVIPVERVHPPRFDTPVITVPAETAAATAPGTFVREAGSDVARGAVALPAGTVLGPAALGVCAALGLTGADTVLVRRGPRVLVVSGGDEVLPAGAPLRPGTVHDANGPLLRSWFESAGAESVTHLRVDDDVDAFTARLRCTVGEDHPDLVVTSGGISAGAFEVVRQALERIAADVWFGHVAVQPGGPQGCGTVLGVPVLCLPGNPVSTWVSCESFVRPALAAVWGCCAPPRWVEARLGETMTPLDGRTQLRRGILDTVGGSDLPDGTGRVPRVSLVGGASSHLLTAAARADVLVRIPPGTDPLPVGTAVAVLPVAGGVVA
ncbi:molybdopterin molybdenumtransferase MoeA [Kocuria tytonicola]|uniref:Molybdopterin molybdenumtransferase n=1 Tax=Kocuria tytonicola TaxID=2055946 RepID=A0A3L9L8X1_9MICC|nr:gephyrin-like molybdotransferase Glp [Kocuria tytonicola]RLY94389.1 molybdopterin molybdenumtransferase MoeA [Kocuria tytonicola]